MFKRKIPLLSTFLLLTILLAGCVFGNADKTKRIYLVWEPKSLDLGALSTTVREVGVIKVEKRFAYQSTEMDKNIIDIEAKVRGGKPNKLEMQLVNTVNEYERVANNKVLLQPAQAEQGTVLVTADEQNEVFDYVIFPAVVLSAWGDNRKETAFSFEQGKKVIFEEADITFSDPREGDPPYHFRAKAIEVPIETPDFWTDFIKANNLHELEYEELVFKPDPECLYYVNTKNGGYAVFRVTANSDWNYNIMYKYSETGIFDVFE